ncbi:GNAT family N-acetyltransferase [Arthrobacter sp. TmT3-37]
MLDDAVTPEDLPALSTRQLRVMVNQAYKLMDVDYPPAGALDRYEMLVEELELRAQHAAGRGPDTGSVHHIKEGFRDNPVYCRFEFFIDGDLAAYMRYRINGGQVILFDGVEQPAFRDQGLDVPLMRHVVLNTHKRRLGLVPRCPMALSFLADNPQYEPLTAQPRH